MTIKTKVHRTVSYTISDSESEREFEVNHEPNDGYTDTIIEILPNGFAVVGYLSQDTDARNPLDDCDSMGKIYDARPRGYGTHKEYWEERGEPGPSDEPVRIKNKYGVLLDVYDHSGEVWRVMDSGRFFPDEQWDVSHGAGIWVPDDACLEHIESSAISKVLPEGTTVAYKSKRNPDGTVDQKNLNVITYTLPDGRTKGGYKSFMTAYRAAAKALGIKLDKVAIDAAAQLIATECAQQAVDEFNKFLAGDCWGVCVEVFDKDNCPVSDDACWGFLGSDHAMESLREEVDSHIKYLKESRGL